MRQAVLGELAPRAPGPVAPAWMRAARETGIDLEHAVERAQVDRDDAGVPRARDRVDAADHARAAADRHDRDVVLAAPVEHRAQLVLRGREGDAVGRVRELAAQPAHDVEVGAALGVRGARPRVVRERRLEPRRRQLDVLERDRQLGLALAEAEVLGEARRGRAQLVGSGLLVLVAPAPVLATTLAHGR